MKMNIRYFDNEIKLIPGIIPVIEIENKSYFYRLIHDLYLLMNGNIPEDIQFFDDFSKEISLSNKIQVILNFFDFQFDSKKYTNATTKYVIDEMTDDDKNNIVKAYKKLQQVYKKILLDVDLPLELNPDISIESIYKAMKISIFSKENLLENLLLMIDLEEKLRIDNILYFVNLKQYLTEQELVEFYKYALYNQVNIILIDSQSYGATLKYEKKLIIDDNLDEFVLK